MSRKEAVAQKATEYYTQNVDKAVEKVVNSRLKPKQIRHLLKVSGQFDKETIDKVLFEVEQRRADKGGR